MIPLVTPATTPTNIVFIIAIVFDSSLFRVEQVQRRPRLHFDCRVQCHGFCVSAARSTSKYNTIWERKNTVIPGF